MLYDNTYFEKLEGFIPNNKDINARPVGSPSVQSEIDAFIKKYERQLMINALGVPLYNELQTALENLGSADQKWQDLVEGRDYVLDGKTYRWDGLRGFEKQGVGVFYIYCNFLRNDEFTYTTTGMVRNTSDNAPNAQFLNKYVIAWSKFIEQYQGKLYYCVRNLYRGTKTLTFEQSGVVYSYIDEEVQSSLFQYLNDANELDPTAFPDFQFKIYAPVNRFGI